jgi:hypothetical protein
MLYECMKDTAITSGTQIAGRQHLGNYTIAISILTCFLYTRHSGGTHMASIAEQHYKDGITKATSFGVYAVTKEITTVHSLIGYSKLREIPCFHIIVLTHEHLGKRNP